MSPVTRNTSGKRAKSVSVVQRSARVRNEQDDEPKKRAICLGGGGPALGLHIGALGSLEDCGIDFRNDRAIWALSCIGAWVGVVYNQAKEGHEFEETYEFFREVFRDDESYQSFPLNTIFAPDWIGCAEAAVEFLLEPYNYRNAFLPRHIAQAYLYTLSQLRKRKRWGKFSEGDFNRWTFNQVLAVHPLARFMTALLYKSRVDGRARLFYKDSQFLKDIKFKRLDDDGKPYIFHNAFNFRKNDIDLFANNTRKSGRMGHKALTPASLCACSALPFVEEVVHIGGDAYCEGALLDTVNFRTLLQDHNKPDDPLQEIWVSRLVDVRQIRQPMNQHDALGNLCQMFAATVGEDDIKLFKYYVRENNRREDEGELAAARGKAEEEEKGEREWGRSPDMRVPPWRGVLVEIPVDDTINYEWSHSNLDRSVERGEIAASAACKLYKTYKDKQLKKWQRGVLVIPEDLTEEEIKAPKADLTPEEIRIVLRFLRRRGQKRPMDTQEDQILAVLASLGLTQERIRAMPKGRSFW
jgi:predicted acylesterase/phospholipase RssA